MGVAYENAQGVHCDYVEANRWFTLAAEQGHAMAHKCLGTNLLKGRGVARDPVAAVRHLRIAADSGDRMAQFLLGELLLNGSNGVPRDVRKGCKLLSAVALSGDNQGSAGGEGDQYHVSALAYLINRSNEKAVASTCCVGCGRMKKLMACERCRIARYCSARCQAKAWPTHKNVCAEWTSERDDEESAESEEEELRAWTASEAGALPIKRLKAELALRSVPLKGLVEKSDLIRALLADVAARQ